MVRGVEIISFFSVSCRIHFSKTLQVPIEKKREKVKCSAVHVTPFYSLPKPRSCTPQVNLLVGITQMVNIQKIILIGTSNIF